MRLGGPDLYDGWAGVFSVETYLQGAPVAGVGGHEETLLLEGPEPQREPEPRGVLVHVVEEADVALAREPQRRAWSQRDRGSYPGLSDPAWYLT